MLVLTQCQIREEIAQWKETAFYTALCWFTLCNTNFVLLWKQKVKTFLNKQLYFNLGCTFYIDILIHVVFFETCVFFLSDHSIISIIVVFLILFFSTRANGIKILTDDGHLASTYATISYDGTVTLKTAANFVSSCNVNIKYYPFDSQECELIVSTSVHSLPLIKI